MIEGLIASILLIAGGLSALQTASVASALPFAIIMLIAAVGMWRALVIEVHHEASLQAHMQRGHQGTKSGMGLWKQRLSSLVGFPAQDKVWGFIRETVHPALREVERELKRRDWPAEVVTDDENGRAYLSVVKENQLEFVYDVRLRQYTKPDYAYPERSRGDQDAEHYYRAEVFLQKGGQAYDIYGFDQQDIINDILDQFEKYMNFLENSPGILPWKMGEHDDDLREREEGPAPGTAS
ncbi:hypothetical protein J2T57_003551 [Natronocella acetinitrilica]|uniref:Choline transporter n=1 Tax=Natronocella acetinitrilica TaxID=414046 RepID=A0AAE3G5Q3_9GAMM|nr:hypothetical protein [Natronocella acetinitrilica]